MTNLADRYAALKAEIDGLTRLLDEVKTEIKATGVAEIVGDPPVMWCTSWASKPRASNTPAGTSLSGVISIFQKLMV